MFTCFTMIFGSLTKSLKREKSKMKENPKLVTFSIRPKSTHPNKGRLRPSDDYDDGYNYTMVVVILIKNLIKDNDGYNTKMSCPRVQTCKVRQST